MCGIAGIHFKNPRKPGISRANLERFVDELLKGIEPRGTDATGLLTVDVAGVPNLVKADTCASTFVNWRDPIPKRVRTILGHTRLATQGSPQNLDNNHPVQYGTCFAIHNGHIMNDTDLFKEHSLDRHAEVDSEIIPALFAKYGLDKAHLALQELDGGFATAVVDPDRFPNMTILAKGWTSPVEVFEMDEAIVFASTAKAIQEACENVLGFCPSPKVLDTLGVGDLLLMEGETVERLTFKPKTKTYSSGWKSYSSGSYSYSSGSYSYSPSTGRQSYRSREDFDALCKSCGCKRLWHGTGSDVSGPCHHVLDNGFSCRCIAFVEPEVVTTELYGMEFCDGCGREVPIGDLVRFGRYFLCAALCARGVFSEGPSSEQLRKSAEAVIEAQVREAELLDTSELADGPWEARMEALHEQALELASIVSGMTPGYLDWLLFQAPIELFNIDGTGYLNEAHKRAEAAYDSVYKNLEDEVSEVDSVRWMAGDVKLGDACNTESENAGEVIAEEEECGVVVTMEEWQQRKELTA